MLFDVLNEVDLSRFNSYPNIYSVPGGANIIIDKLHEESLLGRGKGTRLSTRKLGTRKHFKSGKSTGNFNDVWVSENNRI